MNPRKLGDQQSQESEIPDEINFFELKNATERLVPYQLLNFMALHSML